MTSQALTKQVPLRTSAIFDFYKNVVSLPVIYGAVRIVPIPHDNSGNWFFLADHSAIVTSVTRNGSAYSNWAYHNRADSFGRTISLLETGDEIADDDEIIVNLQGLTDPDDGRLLTNPADVIESLLSEISGYDLSAGRLAAFRDECAAEAITVAGVVDNSAPTLRSTISEIIESIGAMWSLSMPNIARLYPASALPADEMIYGYFSGSPTALGVLDSSGHQADYDESEIITELQIDYSYDWAEGQYGRSIVAQVDNQTLSEYGRRASRIDAKWLTGSAAADLLADRFLKWAGRPKWSIEFKAVSGGVVPVSQIVPGNIINLSAIGSLPTSGNFIVKSAIVDQSSGESTISIEGAVGLIPAVSIVQRSQRSAARDAEFFFRREGETAIINTTPGATVSLNGRAIKADNNGRAFFVNTPPGVYEITITLPGYESIGPIEVTIP